MPLIPAPPMPTKCTAPELGRDGHRARPGRHVGGAHPRSATSSTMSASRSSASGAPAAAACRGVPGQRRRVGQQRHQVRRRPTPASRSASSTSSPPPASTTGRALRRCSPLPMGSGTNAAGQPDGGQLGHGHRAGPAQRQVGGGVGEVHALQVVHDHVRRTTRRARRSRHVGVLRAARVQHLDAGRGQRVGGGDGRPVQRGRALRAAEDQQGRPVGVQPERGAGLGPAGGPVQRADRGRSGMPTCSPRCSGVPGDGDRHPGGEPGAEPVGQPGQRVLLVHHDRDPARRAAR